MKRAGSLAIVFLSLAVQGEALTLERALAETLARNPRIAQAKTALEEAAGQRLILRSRDLPNALVGVVAGDQGGHRNPPSDSDQPFAFAYGSFRAPLFDVAFPHVYRRGEIELLVAQQQLNVAVSEELQRARIAFYTALYQRELESLGKAQRDRLEENLAGEKSRYQAGNVDRSAFTSATLAARALDPKIADAHTASGSALLQLATSMGGALGPGATLPQPEGELHFHPIEFRGAVEIENALHNRPDLKLARLLVHSAGEDQRIIAAGYYPEVDAVASGEGIPVSGVHRDSGGSPQASDDTVSSEVREGAAYTWRVIDNGAVGGAVAQARAIRETNEIELRKLELSVPRELARLQNNLRAIEARYRSLTNAADAAEQTVASVQENRGQGLASVLDFRSAESSLLETRSGILTAIYEENVALAEWDRATGRLFQFSGDTATKVH